MQLQNAQEALTHTLSTQQSTLFWINYFGIVDPAHVLNGNIDADLYTNISMYLDYVTITGSVFMNQVKTASSSINLPVLRFVGGDFEIRSTVSIVSIDMNRLAYVGGGFIIRSNTNVVSLSFPSLAQVCDALLRKKIHCLTP